MQPPPPRRGPADATPSDLASWRRHALLVLLPLLLLLPALLPGARFLPQAPVGYEPLASESAASAAQAWRDANFWTGDRVFPCLTDQLELRKRFWSGVSPTWEPRQALGIPLFATAITGTLYPPNWIALLIDPDLAAAPLAILSLYLAGLGMWKLLERLGLRAEACWVGALCFQAGGFGWTNLHYPMKVDAALWLPWCLWAVEGLANGIPRSAATLLVCATLPLLAGFPPIAFFVLGATAVYALVRLAPRARRLWVGDEPARAGAWKTALLALVGAALLSGVQLVPTYEASQSSMRTERSAENLWRESLTPATSAGLVLAGMYGSPLDAPSGTPPPGAWWFSSRDDWQRAAQANGLEWTTFAGALCIALALAGACCAPRRAWFPLVLGVGALGFAQGWPGLALLFHVPGLNLGAPSRALALAWTAWPWLAAIGAHAWWSRERRARGILIATPLVLACAGLVAWWLASPEQLPQRMERVLAQRHAISLDEVRANVPPAAAATAARELRNGLCVLIASALALAIFAAARLPTASAGARASALRWQLALAALCAPALVAAVRAAGGDARDGWLSPHALWWMASSFALAAWYMLPASGASSTLRCLPLCVALATEALALAPAHLAPREQRSEPVFPASTTLARIAEATGAEGRVLRYDTSASGAADVEQLARPNLLHAYGVNDLSAYIAFTPRWYVELLEHMDARTRFRSGVSRLADLAQLDHPLLDLLRVRCVLSRAPLPRHERLLALQERGGFCVYQRRGSMPLARVVPRALELSPDDVLARVAAGAFDPTSEVLLSEPDVAGDQGGRLWQAGEVRALRSEPGALDFEIRGSSGGWLVVSEQWYPGWRAWLGDAELPTLRADHAFRAYAIPAGDSTLHTEYAPRSLRIGAALSGLGLALLAWLALRRA